MRGVRIVLFALVWFSAAWFGSWELNPNNATRMFAAMSIVEGEGGAIDRYQTLTIDKAMFDGHYYLDKAPGMTLIALPAVALADAATGRRGTDFGAFPVGPDFEAMLRLRTRLAAASGTAVLTALAAVALFDLALILTGSAAAALFAALGFALGTPIWGWSTTVMGHAPVAALYVIAIWAIVRGEGRGLRYAAVTGLALGGAVVIEHQALLAGAPIGLLALWQVRARGDRMRWIAAFLGAGIVTAVPFLAYNALVLGDPLRVGYAGVVGWEGMHRGVFGLVRPQPRVLVDILNGRRIGLVWVAPVLLLAPVGLALMLRDPHRRALALACIASVAIALLVNAAYVYWQGGNTTGPRFAMPAVGPLAIGLAAIWLRLRAGWPRIAAALVLGGSIALNAAIASAEIFAPPTTPFPLWDGVLAGRFAAGDLRTVASEWFGWTPWYGFALWAVCALAMLGWLVERVRRA
ncbi:MULTISPECIES: hypothetical protein [unclassified Sphingomonas]|uniref:hypothetical protein n=1 Tax=unclassified Sphingomonas TaxID=196159 RepID=UPI000E10B125|nr:MULTISPECIES: hypothetical protein [unclassified Sphingomonas]AXJ94852.1 hypothetical protein DM480_04365 [Sphingomonas sp. FARSPH]